MCALVTGVHTCALPISSALLMGISCSTESGGRRQQGGTAARRHYKPSSVAFAFGLAGGVGMGGVADAAAFGLAALQPEARLLSLWPVDDEDRKSVVQGKRVSVRVDLVGSSVLTK